MTIVQLIQESLIPEYSYIRLLIFYLIMENYDGENKQNYLSSLIADL
jgi:hypothetical protein